MTNVQLTLNTSKYLVHFCFSFSIISQIQSFSHTVLQSDKKNRVKKGITTTVIMSVSYTLITAVFLTIFSKEAVGLFSQDEEVIYYGSLAIMYFAPFYWILGILQTLAGAVRGTGKTMPPMIILLISLCLFRVLWMKTVLNLFTSIVGIYVLYPVSWAFGAVLMILYVCKGKWLDIKQI